MSILPACVPAVHRGQERVLDPLELELQMVVSQYVGAENQNCVLWKNSQCFSLLSYLSDPWTSLQVSYPPSPREELSLCRADRPRKFSVDRAAFRVIDLPVSIFPRVGLKACTTKPAFLTFF